MSWSFGSGAARGRAPPNERRSMSSERTIRPFAGLLLAACVLALPSRAECQLEPPIVWELDDVGTAAAQRALRDYYHSWMAFPPDLRSPCDADETGFDCWRGDHEGGCNRLRCRTVEERAAFVAQLADNATRYPESPVALGHAVFAAVKFRHFDEAEALGRACADAGAWWCLLAMGHVQHRRGESQAAEVWLRDALVAMPPEVRCGFESIEALLPEDMREAYRNTPCGEREALHEVFWWLSDPFFVVSGNDRWREHLSRTFEAVMRTDLGQRLISSNAWRGLRYDEYAIRRGRTDSFDRRVLAERRNPVWTSVRAAYNHFVPDVFSFFQLDTGVEYRLLSTQSQPSAPTADLRSALRHVAPGDEGYTRPAGRVHSVPAQLARFLDGDSLVVAVAADVEAAGVTEDARTFVVASRRPGDFRVVGSWEGYPAVRIAAKLADSTQLLSIEVSANGPDGRRREVVRALGTTRTAVSDILLFDSIGAGLPASWSDAVPAMLTRAEVDPKSRLGIYFEAYGFASGESVRVAVGFTRSRGGFLRGLLGAIGLGGGSDRSVIRWTEPIPSDGVLRRGLTLDPGTVGEGEHEIAVEVTGPDGEVLRTTRNVVVREAGG